MRRERVELGTTYINLRSDYREITPYKERCGVPGEYHCHVTEYDVDDDGNETPRTYDTILTRVDILR